MLLFLLWLRLDNNLLQRFVVFGFDSARRAVNRRESQWIVVSGVTFAHNWQQLIDLRTVAAISGLLSVVPMFALCLVTSQNLLRGSGGQPLLPLLPLCGCQIHGSPAVCGSHKEEQETQRDSKRNTEKCKYCYIDKPRSLLSLPLSRSRSLSPTLPLSLTLITT